MENVFKTAPACKYQRVNVKPIGFWGSFLELLVAPYCEWVSRHYNLMVLVKGAEYNFLIFNFSTVGPIQCDKFSGPLVMNMKRCA